MAVVYQIGRRGARLRAKKFFGTWWKCCQCGNVASSNVANGQWGVENVANVEMLPVPMLPMANGEGVEARHPDESG